jgi:4-amino-4-deoxy-L-arabinose transferase-like glycosyltransferase
MIVGLVLLTVVRLLAAAAIPLTEDEAYYRLWAQHPAFGYFDHPPMVAWWIAAGRALVGDSALGVRLLPVFATTLATVLIIDIGRTLGLSDRASARAGLWYNAMFLIGLGGAVATPDAPATLFWTATLWALAKAQRSGAGAWWLLAGGAAGLATLSKYSALFIGPGVLLWLSPSREGRAQLLRPWPWLALLVGGAVFSPNLIWNAGHHWLSFSKQFSRVAPSAFTPAHVIDFPATQFFLINPIIAVFAVLRLRDFNWTKGDDPILILPLTTAPFLAYLVAHSVHAGVQAHWPAPLYPAIALLAASAADLQSGAGWRRAAAATPWLGLGLSLVVLLHMALPQTDWLGRKDPTLPLRGWSRLAADVERLRQQHGAAWVGTFSYGAAAQLAEQRKTAAPIVELIERARYTFQAPAPLPPGPGLVVELSRRIDDADLVPCFKQVKRLADLERGDPGRRGARYSVFVVADPTVDILAEGCRAGKDR